jgi:FlaA1/EpsC-like NDP-sugar epimerase
MRVFRHSLLPGALPGMIIDLFLCFAALLLAASTLTTRYATIPRAVPELPLILIGATIFALVMATMYAVVGLYRPVPISTGSVVGRTIFALAVGGYVTSLSLRSVADRGYIEQLLPAAIAYLVVGLVFVRAGIYLMRRVATLPRVLIIGTGSDALTLAADMGGLRNSARDVVGLYPSSVDTESSSANEAGLRVFSRDESITDLVSRHDVHEIVVAVREQRGAIQLRRVLACTRSLIPLRMAMVVRIPAPLSSP